ncbi:hypothetical protein BDU57DRAFT_114208 [Ampelomyces quisqualis]|uniref:Uncharacterized protein n=1 Tax=Ampelomyces quisqualis TaxID=50730 RepID=A0A6A5Q607_AMPQU|nr:hypothetical protein BDU57DRAFT_114208 [Ampelomyces quisqualis]
MRAFSKSCGRTLRSQLSRPRSPAWLSKICDDSAGSRDWGGSNGNGSRICHTSWQLEKLGWLYYWSDVQATTQTTSIASTASMPQPPRSSASRHSSHAQSDGFSLRLKCRDVAAEISFSCVVPSLQMMCSLQPSSSQVATQSTTWARQIVCC